jgi:DNA-binding MarR family transcriptional regulator/ribosomal protein S18 acetylase RimI-like enzyme
MNAAVLDEQARRVRAFNRFYTQRIGVLQEGLLDSPFSLTEMRVLYELAHGEAVAASALGAELGLDAGYLSRILRRFEQKGFIARERASDDARRSLITLTDEGRRTFAPYEARSQAQVTMMLEPLAREHREALVSAMDEISDLLALPRAPAPWHLRTHQPGDIGWVIERHGLLYAEEYAFNANFEALVAEIGAKFLREFDPSCERCWIAERGVERLGSIFLVRRSGEEAQLRLLLVEPAARGLGIGKALVDACVAFAREVGYTRIMLWTNAVLLAARHLYEAAGFMLVEEDWHDDFGAPQKGQTWVLQLHGDAR